MKQRARRLKITADVRTCGGEHQVPFSPRLTGTHVRRADSYACVYFDWMNASKSPLDVDCFHSAP
jgi:hypothetical protein